jgi:hypothetical protein
MADVRGLAVDVTLSVVELADLIKRLAGDLGLGRPPKVVEVASQVGPTGGLSQTQHATRFRLIKLGIVFVTVGLKDTTGFRKMAQDMLFLPVRCEPIHSTGGR